MTEDNKNKEQQAEDHSKTKPEHKLSLAIDNFLNDLECIKEMFSLVVPVLKDKDDERQKSITNIATKISEAKESAPATPIINGIEALDFLRHIRRLKRADNLFRQNTIVSIVSRFDEFITEVSLTAFKKNPNWLKNPDKKISYKELMDIESIDNLKNDLILREIGSLMRDSHVDQIEFLDEKLKIGIKDNFKDWTLFIEVTERRNLFVHTGGKVSDQYLTVCKKHDIKLNEKIREGSSLSVSDDYFEKAFNSFFELSIRIGQAASRRLFPDALKEADSMLNHYGYELLQNESWTLAEKIFDFALSIPQQLLAPGEYRYYYLLNKCIALKWSGGDYKSLLASQDWEAFHPKYHLAIQVLNDDFAKASETMKSQDVVEAVEESGFKDWPLFRDFRKTDLFKDSFKEIFKKDFDEEILSDAEKELKAQQDTGDECVPENPC